ncbi:MAG: hypothetical protein AB8H47_08760 [Bacteroidia bacterium]
MKNSKLLSLCFLLFAPLFLHAQNAGPRTHQLSLELLGLVHNNNVAVLYWRHQENTSIRFGLSGSLRTRHSDGITPLFQRANYDTRFGLRIGKAFHKTIREFDLYYGADAFLSCFFTQEAINEEFTRNGSFVNSQSWNRLIQPGLAIQPFLGLNYAINEIVSLGLEIRSSLGYTLGIAQSTKESMITNLTTNEVEMSTTETGPTETHSFNLDLINFYGLWLSIHL